MAERGLKRGLSDYRITQTGERRLLARWYGAVAAIARSTTRAMRKSLPSRSRRRAPVIDISAATSHRNDDPNDPEHGTNGSGSGSGSGGSSPLETRFVAEALLDSDFFASAAPLASEYRNSTPTRPTQSTPSPHKLSQHDIRRTASWIDSPSFLEPLAMHVRESSTNRASIAGSLQSSARQSKLHNGLLPQVSISSESSSFLTAVDEIDDTLNIGWAPHVSYDDQLQCDGQNTNDASDTSSSINMAINDIADAINTLEAVSLTEHKAHGQPSLLMLPTEIICSIAMLSGFRGALSLRKTSSRMFRILSNPTAWTDYKLISPDIIENAITVMTKVHTFDHLLFGEWHESLEYEPTTPAPKLQGSVFFIHKTFLEQYDYLGGISFRMEPGGLATV
eukprot:jgi/Hompol1/6120/HPOL_000713-RA